MPLHLRNAPTKLMKELEYGKGYKYAHDEADAVADMSCLPPALEGRKYYDPPERGFEKEIKRRLDGWAEIKKKRRRLNDRLNSCLDRALAVRRWIVRVPVPVKCAWPISGLFDEVRWLPVLAGPR